MNWRALVASTSPQVAVGIAPDRVTAISVGHAGGKITVAAHASAPLPAGAVEPSLTAANFTDRARVVTAVRKVFDQLGQRPRRVALALPDTVGKVSLLRFEKVPGRADDLEELIRFQMRKAAPFRMEDAQVTYSPGAPLDGGGREYVVVVARRDVVREYEDVCAEAGAQAGLVDLAGLNVLNAALAGREGAAGDWLLVHVTSQHATVAILRDGYLILHRTRGNEADGNLSGLVHQTAMYYEDRLGGKGFSKALLVGGGSASAGGESGDGLRRTLQDRLRVPVDLLRPEAIRFPEGTDAATVDLYMPLAGLLVR